MHEFYNVSLYLSPYGLPTSTIVFDVFQVGGIKSYTTEMEAVQLIIPLNQMYLPKHPMFCLLSKPFFKMCVNDKLYQLAYIPKSLLEWYL